MVLIQRYPLFSFNSHFAVHLYKKTHVFLLVTVYLKGPNRISISLFFRREFLRLCVLSIFVFWIWEIWKIFPELRSVTRFCADTMS